MAITLTERAALEVKKIVDEQKQAAAEEHKHAAVKSGAVAGEADQGCCGTATATASFPEKLYLRMRVVGGGCSGFQHKLDLDPNVNEKLDEVFEFHGVPMVVDKRSLMYLNDAQVDFVETLQGRGFHISNPSVKSTCGCGSSFSM